MVPPKYVRMLPIHIAFVLIILLFIFIGSLDSCACALFPISHTPYISVPLLVVLYHRMHGLLIFHHICLCRMYFQRLSRCGFPFASVLNHL